MSKLQCIVVTPERTLREGEADFVALTLFDGEIGIGAGHSPLLGRMGSGPMRITLGDKTERYYVEGGFVEVLDNTVTVLTPRALPADQVDVEAARNDLKAARQLPAHTPERMSHRDRLVNHARARIRVASK